MAQLIFNLADLIHVIDHATAAPKHSPSFGQLFDASLWKPGTVPNDGGWAKQEDLDDSKIPPQIFLVKDSGCYLMSAGVPDHLQADGGKRVVVYAKGCNPATDEDCYDECLKKCGGDDFVEALPAAMFKQAIHQNQYAKTLVITMTTSSIRMRAK